jgi:hypothetical protein
MGGQRIQWSEVRFVVCKTAGVGINIGNMAALLFSGSFLVSCGPNVPPGVDFSLLNSVTHSLAGCFLSISWR